MSEDRFKIAEPPKETVHRGLRYVIIHGLRNQSSVLPFKFVLDRHNASYFNVVYLESYVTNFRKRVTKNISQRWL